MTGPHPGATYGGGRNTDLGGMDHDAAMAAAAAVAEAGHVCVVALPGFALPAGPGWLRRLSVWAAAQRALRPGVTALVAAGQDSAPPIVTFKPVALTRWPSPAPRPPTPAARRH